MLSSLSWQELTSSFFAECQFQQGSLRTGQTLDQLFHTDLSSVFPRAIWGDSAVHFETKLFTLMSKTRGDMTTRTVREVTVHLSANTDFAIVFMPCPDITKRQLRASLCNLWVYKVLQGKLSIGEQDCFKASSPSCQWKSSWIWVPFSQI